MSLLLVVRLVFEREAREIQSCLSLQHALRCQNEDQHSNTNNRTPTLEHQHSYTNTQTQVRFKPSIRHPIKIRSRSSILECVRVHLRSPDLIARTRTIRVNVLEVRIRVERIDSTRVNPSYRSDTVSRTQVSPTRCRLRPHRFHSSPWIT